MKKVLIYSGIAVTLALGMVVFLKAFVIQNPKPHTCNVKEITVANIDATSSFDIKFYDGKGVFYYINRGLEQGYTVEGLKAKVLNKKVTLHLPRVGFGLIESEHIAQLKVEDEILFSEFEGVIEKP